MHLFLTFSFSKSYISQTHRNQLVTRVNVHVYLVYLWESVHVFTYDYMYNTCVLGEHVEKCPCVYLWEHVHMYLVYMWKSVNMFTYDYMYLVYMWRSVHVFTYEYMYTCTWCTFGKVWICSPTSTCTCVLGAYMCKSVNIFPLPMSI